jgi:Helicase HerA, central domain
VKHTPRPLFLGAGLPPRGGQSSHYQLPVNHLVTHGVVLGMTGSGKSGLLMVTVEEALRSGVPCILIDVKGDLPNLLLAIPNFEAAALVPWVDNHGVQDPSALHELAARKAAERQEQLRAWGLDAEALTGFAASTHVRVLTPGSTAGEPLHILSSLERRKPSWDTDPEASRAALSAALSLVLRLLGRDPDPAKSREHVLLSVLAERRLLAGQDAELGSLLDEVTNPPIERIGALSVDEFLNARERRALASALNTLLASPTFASWRQGSSLDVGEWLTPKEGRTPAVVVSVAHLDDEERTLVLGVLLEEILAYTRGLRGTSKLRALVVFDEVYGLLPPHPANPPTKRPTVQLMKQGRAFGVGVIVASQNPMDLDYRALSNAGFWAVGRLQTDADRERVVDSLANVNEPGASPSELHALIKDLSQRWFVVRNVHQKPNTSLLHPRWALSYLRGPMTLGDIKDALGR